MFLILPCLQHLALCHSRARLASLMRLLFCSERPTRIAGNCWTRCPRFTPASSPEQHECNSWLNGWNAIQSKWCLAVLSTGLEADMYRCKIQTHKAISIPDLQRYMFWSLVRTDPVPKWIQRLRTTRYLDSLPPKYDNGDHGSRVKVRKLQKTSRFLVLDWSSLLMEHKMWYSVVSQRPMSQLPYPIWSWR